jgi:hypothetical protein
MSLSTNSVHQWPLLASMTEFLPAFTTYSRPVSTHQATCNRAVDPELEGHRPRPCFGRRSARSIPSSSRCCAAPGLSRSKRTANGKSRNGAKAVD